jgi:Fungal Zn(2)-Cys(6) binuclear cluster domain
MTAVMATHTSLSRSAPIPIAAAQSRLERPQTSTRDTLIKPKVTPAMASPGAAAQGSVEPSNTRTRRDRPCDACRRRKSRCVIHEGAEVCVLCEFHKQECTFVQSPQPRKRRLNSDGREEEASKRRYASTGHPRLHLVQKRTFLMLHHLQVPRHRAREKDLTER